MLEMGFLGCLSGGFFPWVKLLAWINSLVSPSQ